MSLKSGVPSGPRPDRRRSSGKRKTRTPEQQAETPRKVELRAQFVVMVVETEPWMYGSYSKLSKRVQQQFGVSKNTADAAVTRAYEILDAGLAKFKENVGSYLMHVHKKTIEKGFREDGRLITPASKALAQLVGAEAPQGVHVSGGTTSTMVMSADDRVLLESLKLTNAQRLAEIDRIDKELADEAAESAAPAVEPTGQPHPAEGDDVGLGDDDVELDG